MIKKITDLQPDTIWKHFYNLTQIPRPSGYEAAVIEHIKQFAESHNLQYIIDEAGNILVRKEAQKDKVNSKKVVLQSHVDMVPQKNSDKIHDFIKDPIETIIDMDWVKANKTTLGADNGIGVASILAVLESDKINHGPIEGLFTISEETGMDGVFGMKPNELNGDILFNLDSEEEGELIVGCAGGLDANFSLSYIQEVPQNLDFFKLEVKGLKGGHSGVDINLGRANANILLVQILLVLQKDCNIRIGQFSGGNLRNAIPREAFALIGIKSDKVEKLQTIVREYIKLMHSKFEGIEDGIMMDLISIEYLGKVMPTSKQNKILNALNECPNGVISMSPTIADVVQTSTNLSIVKIEDGNCEVKCLLRSSDDQEKNKLASRMDVVFKNAGADVSFEGSYPGWNPDMNSFILLKSKEIYKSLFKKIPEVKVIHAGLECGIIGGMYKNMEMISFGPTIKFPHSPDEKVHIGSVQKYWDFLIKLLEAV
jgi:dipeptidase D